MTQLAKTTVVRARFSRDRRRIADESRWNMQRPYDRPGS
jgi:hypothetical protein